MKEPSYGCKDMAIGCVPYPFRSNAEQKMRDEGDRWDNSYPVWFPCGLMLPFGWLFRGRMWPTCKKSAERRRWEEEVKLRSYPAREQTRYPETRISLCSLKARDEKSDQISILSIDGDGGLLHSGLSRLPLEIRQEIWGYVLGREENTLILLPLKIRAIPGAHPMPSQDSNPYRNNNWHITETGPSFWLHRPAILRTCRQIYIEAVDLLYTENTFVFQSPLILAYFAKAVLPYRFNAIRKVRIWFEQNNWPFWPSCSSRGGEKLQPSITTQREEWRQSWQTIAGMENLTTLHVTFDSTLAEYWDDRNASRDVLLPLLDLRGIRDFKLRLGVFVACPSHGLKLRDVRMTDELELKALVEQVMRRARLPRVSVAVGLDGDDRRSLSSGLEQGMVENGVGDDEIRPASSPRHACG
ncbi:MAG: hypothetical protein L6R38_008780, partial [Xanthoria sp. 2 TBL-2021]